MAHALRSMNDLSGPIALRDRSLIASSDTPPAMRSVVSTAPNSPRMYVYSYISLCCVKKAARRIGAFI